VISEERAKFWHIKYVLNHLSYQHKTELERLSLSKKQAGMRAAEWAEKGHAWAFMYEGKTVAVFGMFAEWPGTWRSWFMATEDYWKLGLSAVRHAKKFLQSKADAGRWCEVLGFRKIQDSGGFRYFIYR
jgi:hypothetical protein